MDYTYQILTLAGVILVGWFVATDKNRNELFKSKLAAYQNLNNLLAKTFSLASHVNVDRERFNEEYQLSCLKLYECVFEISMITSTKVGESILEFLGHAPEEREKQRVAFNKATSLMSKDLNLDRLETITKISCIQYDELKKKLTKKTKGQ